MVLAVDARACSPIKLAPATTRPHTHDDDARRPARTLHAHSHTRTHSRRGLPAFHAREHVLQVSAARETLRRAKWLKGSFRPGYPNQPATVVRVQAAQALVRWLAAAPAQGATDEVSIEPPAEMQRPSRLIELREHHARLHSHSPRPSTTFHPHPPPTPGTTSGAARK